MKNRGRHVGMVPMVPFALSRIGLFVSITCIGGAFGRASQSKAEPNAVMQPIGGNLRKNSSAPRRDAAVLVKKETPLEGIGSPRYPDDHSAFTWADLAGHTRGKLGHVCDPSGSDGQCGGQLVCRQGICRHCISDRECPSFHDCLIAMSGENMCIAEDKKAWEKVASDPWHFLCTLLIFFSSVLSAAAGIGGGGMFVPLLVLFAGLKPESAVPLSQCMIFWSAICNLVVFISQKHTTAKGQPRIDYDCIVLLEPMLCLGVLFGVLLHRMSPQWFLLLLLNITLGMALHRTGTKGLKQRAQENEKMAKGELIAASASPRDEAPQELGPVLQAYINEVIEVTSRKSVHISGIATVWFLMFLASFHGLSPCSWQFGLFFVVLSGLLLFCTFIAIRFIVTRAEKTEKPLDWTSGTGMLGTFTYPAVSFGGGFLGGLLGLGGGVIMSPVLLEVGMHSESVQATTAVIVFLSSSLATIQFALLNQIRWHYALWYSMVTVTATLVGQYLCDKYVRQTGRYSFITLSIAGVLMFSLVALSLVGMRQVYEDIIYGRQMDWSTERLCGGGRLGILDVDVMPAQAWPKDMPLQVPAF